MIWNILINIGIFICFLLITIGSFTLLAFIICSCKASGNCSRKEEQEETLRKLSGKEHMIDDYNLEDELVYDDEFVRKDNK